MTTKPKRTEPEARPDRVGKTAAWPGFEGRLAEVLGALEEDQSLVISSKRGSAYVQFAAQGAFGLRAESVSNNYLPKSRRLGEREVAALKKLGWSLPTGAPAEATPGNQPDGSPNFFRDFERPVPYRKIARMAVRTLTEVHGIVHPGSLDYDAFELDRGEILLPTLGLKRRRPAPRPRKSPAETAERVREQVLEAIRDALGISETGFDEDGDLGLRIGNAIVFVHVLEDPVCVRVYSPLATKIDDDALALDRLNELNSAVRYVRLFVLEGTIYAAMDVSGSPFVPKHAVDACSMLAALSEDMGGTLRRELGGEAALGPRTPESTVQ